MCTYLAKRGTTYYFRRPVPAELRPYLENRREWMLSLATNDRETANFRRCILTLRFQKHLISVSTKPQQLNEAIDAL